MREKFIDKIRKHRWRYSRIFRSIKTLTSLNPKEEVMFDCLNYVKTLGVKGDYLEFGIYEGDSLIKAYYLAKANKIENINYYGFDSFEGLSELSEQDKKTGFEKGQYKCGLDIVKENLKKAKVPLDNIQLIKGFFKETLTNKLKKELPIKKASVILVDSDLYEPAKDVLKFVKSYLQDGTIIIFDDWFFGGEKIAFEEWLEKNKEYEAWEFKRYGKAVAFIIKIKRKI